MHTYFSHGTANNLDLMTSKYRHKLHNFFRVGMATYRPWQRFFSVPQAEMLTGNK